MQQTHDPQEVRTFVKKANVDLDQELLLSELEGYFIELINGRNTDANGKRGAARKILGEELLYDAIDTSCTQVYGGGVLPSNFVLMEVEEINEHIVEIWANRNSSIPPFIRIDGLIVGSHPDMPFRLDYPIQTDKNESCIGGEIFTTDHRTPPVILNIKDMLLNSGVDVGDETGTCTEKYFDDFNIDRYTINLRIQLDQMRFIRIAQNIPSQFDEVYGSTGLLGGSYQYTYQYVTSDGDRSQMAPLTPTIQVPRVVNALSNAYPYSRTFGTEIGDTETTNGVHLRFRVTNLVGYEYMNIIRIPYNADEGLDFVPDAEIIGQYALDPANPITVVNILDYGAEGELVDEIEQGNIMAAVQAAKTIRYFGKRLNLMNITYASRDTEGSVTFKTVPNTNDYMVPVTAHLGKAGHADPWNSCYLKSRQHDEYHGDALVLWDMFGNWTFAQDVPGFENYRMPQNRKAMPQASIDNSLGVPPMQMMDMTATVSHVFEFWDTHDCREKDNACSLKTIVGCEHDTGTVGAQYSWAYGDLNVPIFPSAIFHEFRTGLNQVPGYYGCDNIPMDDDNTIIIPLDPLHNWSGGPPPLLSQFGGPYLRSPNYGILRPTSEYDLHSDIDDDHDFVPNTRVALECLSACGPNCGHDYHPKMFGLDYFSLGMAFGGLTSWPSWAVGFGMVRTRPAGRVVCEGMGFYDMTPNDFNTFGSASGLFKEQDSILAYFPDLTNGMIDATTIADINANPDNYAIQLFAPVGFASEVYNFWDDAQVERDRNVEMVVYPRVQYEDGSINTGDNFGHVEFGKWRGNLRGGFATQNPTPGDVTDGSGNLYEFELSGGSINTVNHANSRGAAVHDGVQAYRINLPASEPDIYNRKSISNLEPGGNCNKDFGKQDMKNWHEPLYMVRIIRKGVNINTTQNIREFVDVGHWQKFESIIGVGDGSSNQQFILVDERWEDCCPDISPAGTYSSRDAFVYVTDTETNDEYPWLNVTYFAAATIATLNADITANGSTTWNGTEIYGLYTHSSTNSGRETYLIFNYQEVPTNLRVVVKYDNTIPIRLFNGDRFVGEDVFCPIDEETQSNPKTAGEYFAFNCGFPYYRYQINPRMMIAKRTYGTYPPIPAPQEIISEWTVAQLDYIRQLIVLFPALQRSHLGFPHERRVDLELGPREGFFPATHYIMRPNRWMPNGETGVPIVTILNRQEDGNWCDANLSYPGRVYAQYRDVDDGYPFEGAGPNVGDGDGLWRYGGFRYEKLINYLYSVTGTYRVYQSRPKVGFEEQTEFCTRHIWSLVRNINVQDEPGLKTFYATNAYDLDDRQGEIKYAYAATSDKGVNLYAFTDSGIALIITDKRIISDLNADEIMLSGVGDEAFVQGEYWLSKTQGMSDEMYRASAERDNAIFFVNKESCWLFSNNALANIGKIDFHYRVRKNYIENILPGYETNIMAVYDVLHEEVWFGIRGECVDIAINRGALSDYYPVPSDGWNVGVNVTDSVGGNTLVLNDLGATPEDRICIFNSTGQDLIIEHPVALVVQSWTIPNGEGLCFTRDEGTQYAGFVAEEWDGDCGNELLVYAKHNEGWLGRYHFSFDKYISFNNRTFGFRDGQTYELHKGYIINGQPIEFSAEQVFNTPSHEGKEWLRVRAASKQKPTSIEFAEELDGAAVAVMDQATFGSLYLKDYHGWEHFIPSKIAPPNNRIQGRAIYVRVKHNEESDYSVASLGVDYKILK